MNGVNESTLKRIVHKHSSNIRRGLAVIPTLKHGIPGALGDSIWTAELLLSTYYQAEHGTVPKNLNFVTGASNGGFDRLHFKTIERVSPDEINTKDVRAVDLSISLNKKKTGKKLDIKIPAYGGGMSFGSISLNFMLSRAIAAKELGTLVSTGEGGYPLPLKKYRDNVIVQLATGMFGVSEATLQMAPVIEFKYAQGAKPGLGGHLLADKVTAAVARMRETTELTTLYSPFPFHSVYSVEDHKKHVDWVKTINPSALVSVKVSTPKDVDMVAIGSYYAGAEIIHIDGSYGGTGAAPEIVKKNIAMPVEYAIPIVHNYLLKEGIRDDITLIASGGIRTAFDVAKAIALGADGVVIGTSEAVAVGCTRCGNCERGRGCQIGITTTDPELSLFIDPEWGARRIVNMYNAWKKQWTFLLESLGLKSVRELVGRKDLLYYEKNRRN